MGRQGCKVRIPGSLQRKIHEVPASVEGMTTIESWAASCSSRGSVETSLIRSGQTDNSASVPSASGWPGFTILAMASRVGSSNRA